MLSTLVKLVIYTSDLCNDRIRQEGRKLSTNLSGNPEIPKLPETALARIQGGESRSALVDWGTAGECNVERNRKRTTGRLDKKASKHERGSYCSTPRLEPADLPGPGHAPWPLGYRVPQVKR